MVKSTAFFSCLFILLTALSSWAQLSSEEWTPRSPLQEPTSFHSYVMSSSNNSVQERFGRYGCVGAIQAHLHAGKDFYSRQMDSPRFSSLMLNHPSPDVKSRKIYHYSKSPELQAIAENKRYNEIFEFLRYRNSSNSLFLYVAGDSNSSSGFGAYPVEFTLSESAKVYFPHGKDNERVNIGDYEVVTELYHKYPALKVCGDASQHAVIPTTIVILAAEASRIDLIAYAGVENRVWNHGVGSNWFWLLNSWSVVESRKIEKR